jgi:hypothetical protein
MADRIQRPLVTMPWSEKYYADAERAQAVEDEDRQLRVEMLKQKLYPADTAQKAAEELMQTTDSARRAALMQTLYETTGTTTIPGTSLNVPSGTPEEDQYNYLEGMMDRVARYERMAGLETDPIKRDMKMKTVDMAKKSIQAKGKELTAADVAFEMNATDAYRLADELEDTVKKYGNYEISNPEGSAALRQKPYFLAVALAKALDPGSVARESEVKSFLETMALGTSPVEVPGLDLPISGPRTATTLEGIKMLRDRLDIKANDYKRISGRTIELPKRNREDATAPAQAQQPYQAPMQQQSQPMSQSGFGGYDPRARKVIPSR